MSEFLIQKERLEKLANDMVQEMEDGLSMKQSSLLMLSTYIHKLPNRSESGKYLALDFGGSTFRVISVELSCNKPPVINSKTYDMEKRMKSVTGEELFDHLAMCVADFIEVFLVSSNNDAIPLGFTFSFPMEQSSLSCGSLIRWTKGFENSNVVGENVAKLLNDALAKNQQTKGVHVAALANDTAGTLVAGCMDYEDCLCGLILGTGSNAAYTEKVANVPAMKGCTKENVVINIEWGNFGQYGHLKDIQTEFDVVLDKSSNNPGKALFEKMISGMYIGELVRLALLKHVDNNSLFGGDIPHLLLNENSMDGSVVSNCIRENDEILALFPRASSSDISTIRQVCNAVSDRAARLAASGVYAIWLKRGMEDFTVAVDGSVYIKHVTFSKVMKKTLEEMGSNVKLEIASDGSGLGSALIAAMASS